MLSWWEGRFAVGWGYGRYRVVDRGYRDLPAITAKTGYQADLHDMQLTDRGTAIVMAYDRVRRDLRSSGGRRDGLVMDNVIQEVDLATGLVLFERHSIGQIAFSESHERLAGQRWDCFHANSVEEDRDGNLIVSARKTCALYKLDRDTGEVIWRLGGKRSDFRQTKRSRFCFQHDAPRTPDGAITLFDNAAGPPVLAPQSRAIKLRVRERRRRVSLLREFKHPQRLLAFNQGGARMQGNGNVFVGWGAMPVFSEFTRSGQMIFSGHLTPGKGNYRAVRARWTGRPVKPPALAASRDGGRVRVFASWNGHTGVHRWQVLAGGSEDSLRPVGAAKRRTGFETGLTVRTRARFVAVRAFDARGKALGRSRAERPRR